MTRRTFFRILAASGRRRGGEAGFIRVAPAAAIEPGKPYLATVTAARWDGYVRRPPGPIGRVWLVKDEGDPAKVRCYQTICPHLGCGIDFSAARSAFVCPCHASEFDVNGGQRFGPSPRNMDELECQVTMSEDGGEAWVEVRYQEFRTGIPRQELV